MLSTREAGEALGLSPSSVRRLARAGALKASRLTRGSHLRFAPEAIREIAEGKTMGVRRERGWWYVQFEWGDVRVHRKAASNTRRDAELLERTIRAQIAAGTWGKRAAPTLRAFAKDYLRHLTSAGRKPSYLYEARCRTNRLIDIIGGSPLSEIGAAEIDTVKDLLLADGLARKSINNMLGHLGGMLRLALRYGKIKGVPALDKYKIPEVGDDYHWLRREEADQLLAATTGWVHAAAIVALHTGLRLGELEALRWADIEGGAMHVRRQWCAVSQAYTTPKGGRSRAVPLNITAQSALDAHPRHLRSELVFCDEDGALIPKCRWIREMRRACVAAGLEPVGWHCLRHTCASWMVSAGVPLTAVQRVLGHASARMTERYAHLAPETVRSAVEAIG